MTASGSETPADDVEAVRLDLAALRFELVRAEARGAGLRDALRQVQDAYQQLRDQPPVEPTPPAMPDPEPLLRRIAQQEEEIAHLRRHLSAFQHSAIWRASWPLRRALTGHPRMARSGRRLLEAGWWTLTLQWPARLRQRAEAHAAPGHDAPPVEPDPVEAAPEPVSVTVQPVPLRLPCAQAPLVSVIIPCFGQVAATLRCLQAVARSDTDTAFEVIVSEDASGDPAVALLDEVEGLRLVRQPRNLGFLGNCNAAALHARGRFLLFLNNDTEPMPGFLDALVCLAQALPDAGLVGSRLLFPDGRLQEAGGIIWQDGTGWNYGRGDDPRLPQYNTVREVDYVSGASILLRRGLWEELQGFDHSFAPAYYEDTDLAFRIRARGLRVLYQPASVVIHHEGLSHGTDVTQGIKANQENNRLRFVSRWPRALAAEHFPSGADPMRASEHARGRQAILVIDHYVPEPDRDAGSRSTLAILRALKDAGWLVKFWPQNRAHNQYTHLLETMGVEVLDGRLPMPFAGWIGRHGAALDHVLTMRPTVAVEFLSDLLRHTKARLSFYGHDVHHLRMSRQAELQDDAAMRRDAEAMRQLERKLWGAFDVMLYPSENEAALVRRMVPGADARPIVLFSFDRFQARLDPPAAPVILFVAGFAHPPNVDAAGWLVREILPHVRRRIPATRLVLAGSHPTEAVRGLADGVVEVTGSLDEQELARHYAEARVAVVPLRVGAGVKGKVVEALQQGLPLVTTPIGAEGLPDLQTVAAVAAEPESIADAIVALLENDRLWRARSGAGTAYVAQRFSRDALATSLFAALEPAPRPAPRPAAPPDTAAAGSPN